MCKVGECKITGCVQYVLVPIIEPWPLHRRKLSLYGTQCVVTLSSILGNWVFLLLLSTPISILDDGTITITVAINDSQTTDGPKYDLRNYFKKEHRSVLMTRDNEGRLLFYLPFPQPRWTSTSVLLTIFTPKFWLKLRQTSLKYEM